MSTGSASGLVGLGCTYKLKRSGVGGRWVCKEDPNAPHKQVAPNCLQFRGTKEAIHTSPGSKMSGGGAGLCGL